MSTAAFSSAAPSISRTMTVPVEFFAGLRQGVLAAHAGSPGLSVDTVRDAGYQAGQALFEQFGHWLADLGEASPTELADARFPSLFEAFFHSHGWGRVEVTPLSDAVMMLDAFDWGEAADSDGGCLVSTGLFAGFLGRLADAPLSVLEVDPDESGPGRCRFLVGSVDVLDYVWDAMQRGIRYERAAQSA
jgi:predicted hydrocarbon binding protein